MILKFTAVPGPNAPRTAKPGPFLLPADQFAGASLPPSPIDGVGCVIYTKTAGPFAAMESMAEVENMIQLAGLGEIIELTDVETPGGPTLVVS
jgi:hypothetical protein